MPRFKIPPGFTLPQGTIEGEDFQLMVTANVTGDEIEVKEIEGIAIEGYEEPEAPEESEEEEEEMIEGETAGDRFTKKFRGKATAY